MDLTSKPPKLPDFVLVFDRDELKGFRKGLEVFRHGYYFIPISSYLMSRIGIGTQVLCWVDGDIAMKNVLQVDCRRNRVRYRVSNNRWIGKNKLIAIIKKNYSWEDRLMEFEEALEKIKNEDIYLYLFPSNPDHTIRSKPIKLTVSSKSIHSIAIDFPSNENEFKQLVQVIKAQLGETKKIIIGWDIKSLFSYVLAKTGRPLVFEGKVYDLKILEAYRGLSKEIPKSFKEASKRLAELLKGRNDIVEVYTKVHLPLITDVIPNLETLGLTHRQERQLVYPFYEIEGQANGRLRASKYFSKSFNPHSTSAEEKENIYPPSDKQVFLYFDYKSMEVNTLQWLSKDQTLGVIINTCSDVYEGIWQILTNSKSCTSKQRDCCKTIFLPVIFGAGAKSIANSLKISDAGAEQLLNLIYRKFETATSYVKKKLDENGFCEDIYGRRRKFTIQEAYKVRNFIIQSPASTICLYKLVELYKNEGDLYKLAYHLHDGYVILTDKDNKRDTIEMATSLLEKEDHFCEGLKLKVEYTLGKNLNL